MTCWVMSFFLDCWNYDKDGEALRLAFRKVFETTTTNNGQTFKEHADYLCAKEQRRERLREKDEDEKGSRRG